MTASHWIAIAAIVVPLLFAAAAGALTFMTRLLMEIVKVLREIRSKLDSMTPVVEATRSDLDALKDDAAHEHEKLHQRLNCVETRVEAVSIQVTKLSAEHHIMHGRELHEGV